MEQARLIQKGIEFYNNLIDECLKYDIEPIVTMFRFDMPAALDERGSWSTHDSVDWFAEYARVLFEKFGDRVKYWLTINEQNMLTLVGPVIGTLHVPEGTTNLTKEIYQQDHHQLVAQAKQCNFAMKCFLMLKLVQHQIFLWFTQRHQNQKMLLLLKTSMRFVIGFI